MSRRTFVATVDRVRTYLEVRKAILALDRDTLADLEALTDTAVETRDGFEREAICSTIAMFLAPSTETP